MADHSKPVLTSTYANFVTELDARFDDFAVGLDPAFSTPTNLPNNSVRWSSASNKWEKWNLTVWSPLSTGYEIDIANGSILNSPISGSTGSFTTLAASGAFSLTGDQVQVSEGGTGATTAATARNNLGAAPIDSPAFTGSPTAPTPANSAYGAHLATSAFVKNVLASYGIGTSDLTDFAGDLNSLYDGGVYLAIGANTPLGGSTAWFVQVATNASNYSMQFAVQQASPTRSFVRQAAAGVWSAWREIVFRDNPDFTGMTKAQNITVTDLTLKINATATGAGYGVIHRNDGVNYYLLLTNLNDALGGYNTLRPMSMNCATGEINFDKVNAPTPPPGTNTDRLATTAFVLANQSKGVGVAQAWHNHTGARSLGVTYYNATAQPMQVHITTQSTDISHIGTLTVGGVLVGRATQPSGGLAIIHAAVIPPGASYVVAQNGPNASISNWAELY